MGNSSHGVEVLLRVLCVQRASDLELSKVISGETRPGLDKELCCLFNFVVP